MEEYGITSELILLSRPALDNENIMEAMREFTGIKIIEAVDLLIRDFTQEQKDQLMSKIDAVIDKVL